MLRLRKPFSIFLICSLLLMAGLEKPVQAAGLMQISTSASYESGVYYSRLRTAVYDNMNASQADRLVAVAMSQKGYTASNKKSNLAGDGDGSARYCEYSDWFYRSGLGDKRGLDWCACFVSWCAAAAGIPSSVIPRNAVAKNLRKGTWHKIWSEDFSTYIDYRPRKGDLLFAMPTKNGVHVNAWDPSAHVAIIAEDSTKRASDGGWMYTTIERISGNKVGQRSYSTKVRAGGGAAAGTHYVQMFVTPNYQANDRTPPTNGSISVYSSDYKPGSPVTLTPHASGAVEYGMSVRYVPDGSTVATKWNFTSGSLTFTPEKEGEYAAYCDAYSSNNGLLRLSQKFTIQSHVHKWDAGQVTKSPTEDAEGVRTYTCTVCGTKKTEAIAKLPHTHSWSGWKFKDSKTHYRVCTKDSSHTETAAHTPDGGKITKAPTCAATGTKVYTCTGCGATATTTLAKLTTHSWNAGVVTTAATCAREGVRTYTCTVCGTQRTEVIPRLTVHSWNAGVVTTAATYTSPGVRTYTCTICGTYKTELIPQLVKPKEDQPTPLSQAENAKEKEKEILSMSGDEAPEGSRYNLLQLRTSKIGKTYITLKWKKVEGASGYIIYGNRCGNKYKKIKTIKSGSTVSWTKKKLSKGKYYKFFIVAVAKDGTSEKVIASSKTIHVATSGGKVGNDKSVKLTNIKKSKKTLAAGKTFTIKAKPVPASSKLTVKRHRTLRYESTDPTVASVGAKNGKISAKKAGTCTIYVYAQSGAFQKIKVTVK